MRTSIVIDAQLTRDAMQACVARTKREAVGLGLGTLVKLEQQRQIKGVRGRLRWDGDRAAQRSDLVAEPADQA